LSQLATTGTTNIRQQRENGICSMPPPRSACLFDQMGQLVLVEPGQQAGFEIEQATQLATRVFAQQQSVGLFDQMGQLILVETGQQAAFKIERAA